MYFYNILFSGPFFYFGPIIISKFLLHLIQFKYLRILQSLFFGIKVLWLFSLIHFFLALRRDEELSCQIYRYQQCTYDHPETVCSKRALREEEEDEESRFFRSELDCLSEVEVGGLN